MNLWYYQNVWHQNCQPKQSPDNTNSTPHPTILCFKLQSISAYKKRSYKNWLVEIWGLRNSDYRVSPFSAVLWRKDKTALIESTLIDFTNKSHEIRGEMDKKPTILDNFTCFQNSAIVKSTLVETVICGDFL